MFKRIQPPSHLRTRFDRMTEGDLETALETTLSRTAELFRGFQHRELDQRWLTKQMGTEIDQAQQIIQALQRKVEL